MDFERGDMVVCLDDTDLFETHGPTTAGVYTVAEVVTEPGETIPGLNFEELPRRDSNWTSYCSARFRKIKKPSIEIFRQIVANVPRELVD